MPRIPTAPESTEPLTLAADANGAGAIPLKRNQACHRCRKRKIKCDAERPSCGSCILAAKTARGGPPLCQYDDEPGAAIQEPKNKFQKLESRITELENQLKATQQEKHERTNSSPSTTANDILTLMEGGLPSLSPTIPDTGDFLDSTDFQMPTSMFMPSPAPTDNGPDALMELLWPSWPARFPLPEMLHHLVEVFFTWQPNAHRLLHKPTFLTRLALSPTHDNYPHGSLIHAICAYASIFSPLVRNTSPYANNRPLSELFTERLDRREQVPITFGEMQANYSRESGEESIRLGESMFDGFQGSIILAWYYYAQAKWVEVWRAGGASLRYSIPMGLNNTPLKRPLHPWLSPPVIPPAASDVELEMRRNSFWLAYAMERWQVSATAWPTALDDEDISQVLPVRLDGWGIEPSLPLTSRQTISTPHMLLSHPTNQTDSFTMYLKSIILLSRVKSFNSRFDPKLYNNRPELVDPRDTNPFKVLDQLVDAFQVNFPKELRDPVKSNGVIDSNAYIACMAPHVAVILLHEPHAEPANPQCVSAKRSLDAALAIIELVFKALSTSYDLCHLESITTFAWRLAGRVCQRFRRVAIQNNDVVEAARLTHSIEVVRTALQKMGERLPVADHQARTLATGDSAPLGPNYEKDGGPSLSEVPEADCC